MSRIIKLTDEYINECTEEFRECLKGKRFSEREVLYTKDLEDTNRRAKLTFTDEAWAKMQLLTASFDTEVAWHGTVKRGDEHDSYVITDILVYPQNVSGAYVDMDVSGYDEWLRDNIADERFNDIRMQGHSHVKMSVNPSDTDMKHQRTILKQMTDDMFYIFLICNKYGDMSINIYDLAENVMFDTFDVDVEVREEGYRIDGFLRYARRMVRDRALRNEKSIARHRGKGLAATEDMSELPDYLPYPDDDRFAYPYAEPIFYEG